MYHMIISGYNAKNFYMNDLIDKLNEINDPDRHDCVIVVRLLYTQLQYYTRFSLL